MLKMILYTSELSVNEKKAMLTKHLQGEDKSLVRSEVDKSSKVHMSSLGYPECCHLYSNKEAFMVIGSQFFERPIGKSQYNLYSETTRGKY